MPKREMPDLGFEKTEFEGRHHIHESKQLHQGIRELLEKLLPLPLLKNQTQREEMLRSYIFNLHSRDISKLPYWSNGIGSTDNTKFKALMAEVSCLVVAYWNWLAEPTDPNLEFITDHMEYLDHVLRDPDTLKTTELPHGHGKSGSCRYRITNDRIINHFKMMED